MMRSLWTAASGMIAQQTNVDTIANNLANVNTTGYKAQTAEFKTLLYQTVQTKTTTANNTQKPIGAQIGLGTRNTAISTKFTDGTFTDTGNKTDFALNGAGFFSVLGEDGEVYYTRNGSFNIATSADGGLQLCNSDGLPVLDSDGLPIQFPEEYEVSKISVTADGEFCYPDEMNNPAPIGVTIGIFQFPNPGGLEKMGESLLKESAASGQAINEAENTEIKKSVIRQGYIEASNVSVVDEMVSLITAQRAYEINSKAIQAADEMLQQANNLRR